MSSPIDVVLQHRDGKLHRGSREAIAAAQALAGEIGGEVRAILLGSGVEELASEVAGFDLAGVAVIDDPNLASYTPGGYVSALSSVVAGSGFVVLPHTYQTVDFMARLAQAVGAGVLPEVTGFESRDGGLVWRRPILGGKLQSLVKIRRDGMVLVSVQSGAFAAEQARGGQAVVERLEVGAIRPDREILGVEEVAGDQVDLTAAERIVAIGRGLGSADKMGIIEELAAALGAEIAASRPVIDSDWLPRDRQIGSSGQTVSPKLYLAIGISGAIQHLVGMKGSQVVVAINKDANAPIFAVSDYGIVGDLHEIVPQLTAAIREAAG